MENKKVRRWRIAIKVISYLEAVCAAMALVLIGNAMITEEITVSGYIWNCVTIFIDSSLLAYIFARTQVHD